MARPKYEITDEICEQAESLAAQGCIVTEIALVLGIGQTTFYEKQTNYPKFAKAITRGRAKGVATITNALYLSAKNGNLGAQCFYLKNRAGWLDRHDVHHEGSIKHEHVAISEVHSLIEVGDTAKTGGDPQDILPDRPVRIASIRAKQA